MFHPHSSCGFISETGLMSYSMIQVFFGECLTQTLDPKPGYQWLFCLPSHHHLHGKSRMSPQTLQLCNAKKKKKKKKVFLKGPFKFKVKKHSKQTTSHFSRKNTQRIIVFMLNCVLRKKLHKHTHTHTQLGKTVRMKERGGTWRVPLLLSDFAGAELQTGARRSSSKYCFCVYSSAN